MGAARGGKGRPRPAARGKAKAAKPAAAARKPRPGRRGKSRAVASGWRWLLWPAGLLLVLAAVALAWFWPGPAPVRPPAPSAPPQPTATPTPAPATRAVVEAIPPYEEPLNGADLSHRLVAVDEALFAALGRAGVASDRIRLNITQQPDGELTRLRVRLAPDQDAGALARALALALRGKADQVREQGREARAATILVHLGQRLTHQVELEPSGAPTPTPPAPPPAVDRPRVAIVIDDLGHSLEAAHKLLALDLPLGFSVLPFSAHGREVAQEARARGREVLLHLPMEPKSYPGLNPGPGALLARMGPERLRQAVQAALEQVPGVAGMNNHMGSRLTEDRQAMQAVCEVLRQRGLFLLDSLTSPHSQAWRLAQAMGVAFARRDLFLDHDPGREAVTAQIARLIELAKLRGQAVAIGHPHASTIQALAEQAGRLRQEVELTPISRLLTRPPAPGS
ncbi:MAG: divergent polysaccharide deacetylase family protein [Thermodesulfobacteriota bacterium]